jgi:hypothetical protein
VSDDSNETFAFILSADHASDSTSAVLYAAATDAASESQDGMSFLNLPAEIRNQIYNDALVKDNNNTIKIGSSAPYTREPALLLANKQVRNEAMPVFYGQNEFRTPSGDAFKLFMQRSGRERLSLLRSVRAVSGVDMVKISSSFRSELKQNLSRGWIEPNALSKKRFCMEYHHRRIHELGQDLVRIGEDNGMLRAALLFPIFGTGEGSDFTVSWVSIDEAKKYA